jgi:hypothetical protein
MTTLEVTTQLNGKTQRKLFINGLHGAIILTQPMFKRLLDLNKYTEQTTEKRGIIKTVFTFITN